jgi:peptidoglycan/LPS O-acetylase OafA/YrhL
LKLPARDDIQCLRAIAVLAVVGFHFEAPRVLSGFVGVDIFFVISGFLITGIIQSEVQSGHFSFAGFYERRVRRLLPALYAMLVLTAIPSFHYLLTSERMEFFRSAISTLTFTSNFFFWYQTGYFDHAAVEKPLLHTWSLAVEEQFYLAMPLMLWALLRVARDRGRRLLVPLVIASVMLASFALGIWLIAMDRSPSAFFLSPPRAWEFLIGAILAVERFRTPLNVHLRRIARGLGLVLILVAIFAPRPSHFPGFAALLPCLGAALFIWSGNGVPPKPPSRNWIIRVMRFYGRISYSMYLWHWPLFTFARFSKQSLVLDPWDKIALSVVTLAVSYLSWRFVEQPFLRKSLAPTQRLAFKTAGIATAVLLGLGLAAIAIGGSTSEADRYASRLEAYDTYDARRLYRIGSCFRQDGGAIDEANCLTPAAGKQNILLWGDSYAAHYYHGLDAAVDRSAVNVLQADQAACMPTISAASQGYASCRDFAASVASYFETHKPDIVVMSADWLEYARPPRFDGMIANLRETISYLNGRGVAVVLLGPSVQFRSRLPQMLVRAYLRHVDPVANDFVLPDIFALDRMMKAALPAQDRFSYLSVLDAVCPAQQCPLTIENGVPLAWDHAHLTAEGSAYVVSRLTPQMGLKK